jgi:hypothetical protein
MNGQNKTDDARILTMNEKARQILRQDPAGYPMHTVGELIRYLGDSLRWTGIATSQDGYATRIDYRNPSGDEFSMIIELVNQIVVITIAERTGPTSRPPTAFLGCSDWVERCSVDGCCRGEHGSIHTFLRTSTNSPLQALSTSVVACYRIGLQRPTVAPHFAAALRRRMAEKANGTGRIVIRPTNFDITQKPCACQSCVSRPRAGSRRSVTASRFPSI